MLLTQDRSLFTETECESRGETDRQKLNNLISNPLFTTFCFLISHFLTSTLISPSPSPFPPQISLHISPAHALICSQTPFSLISPLLYPVSTPWPSSHFLCVPLLLFLIPFTAMISRSAHILKTWIISNYFSEEDVQPLLFSAQRHISD